MHAGKSSLKQGQCKKIPPQFTAALATHSTVKQVAVTDNEASATNMIPFIKATTDDTKWEGKFSLEYAWRKTCRDHLEHFVPAKAKDQNQ